MGLFNRLFGSQNDDLEKFNDAIREYQTATSDGERLVACDRLLTLFLPLKESDIVRIVKTDGKKSGNWYFHDVLGSVSTGQAFGVTVYDNLKKTRDNIARRITALNNFRAALDNIPRAPVVIDPEAGKTKRRSLADMSEIKYSNITKSFNPDKLPSFVVIDTETNGVQIQGGRILELSAIRYEDFQPVEVWTTLVNPEKPIPAEVTAINHITDEMVSSAPTLAQVSTSFIDFVGGAVLVGYNLPFDLKFLFSRGIDLTAQKRKYYDVLELARKAYKNDLSQFRLVDVAEECGVPTSVAHRSFSDCYATGVVFRNCIDRITGVW